MTAKIEDTKKTVESAEKEAKATIVTLPGGKEAVEKALAKEEEEKKSEKKSEKEVTISPTSITVTSGNKGKTSTGKPIAPPVPAPKPKEEEKKDKDGKVKPSPVPVQPRVIKKKVLEGEITEEDDEDDGEPADVSVTEVPGGEAQIQKEVTDNTLAAHNARVELVKTKENLKYELRTIKDSLAKFKETVDKTTESLKKDQESLKTE